MGPIGLREQQKYHDSFCGKIVLEWKTPQFHKKNIVLVEGIRDKCVYSKFVSSITEVRTTSGCRELLEILKDIRVNLPVPSIAIKDSDFCRVNNSLIEYSGFFYTDAHDCEMMMLSCNQAFVTTISELSIRLDKIQLSHIWDLLKPISLLKWFCFSSIPEKRLYLRGLKVWDMSDCQAFSFEYLVSNAQAATKDKGRDVQIDLEELKSFCNSKERFNEWEVVNGHDFIKMLITHTKNKCSAKSFYEVLSSNYSLGCFKKTELYRAVKEYESTLSERGSISFFV